MLATRRHLGPLSVIVAILVPLVSGAFVPATHVSAQWESYTELAYGQETGFFFFWDPAIISLEEQVTEPGFDYWRLSDGEATVEISAYTEPGVTPTACVRDFVDYIASDPAVQAIEDLPTDGGGPMTFGRESTSEDFVVTFADQNGSEKFAVGVACFEVARGEAFAVAFTYMPARVYNERKLAEWVYVDEINLIVYTDLHEDSVEPIRIPTPSDAAATLRTSLGCNSRYFEVLVEGLRDTGALTIDPSTIIAVDETGEIQPITVVAWSLQQEREVSTLHLASGEIGLLSGEVDVASGHPFSLYYAGMDGERIFLARRATGCGGGAAAPVPIDID